MTSYRAIMEGVTARMSDEPSQAEKAALMDDLIVALVVKRRGPGNVTVTPDGTVHETQADAAAHLGISTSAVARRLELAGNLDPLPIGRPGQPVRCGKHKWPTMTACARDLGVTVGAVSQWVKKGRHDLFTKKIEEAGL